MMCCSIAISKDGMLFYLVFNGVYYQAAVVFPINLHILKIAPIPKVHSLWFLFDFEKNEVDSAFLIYINKGKHHLCPDSDSALTLAHSTSDVCSHIAEEQNLRDISAKHTGPSRPR